MTSAPTAASAAATPPALLNGGSRAWLQVLASFSLYMNTWGLLSSYGTLQSYYETQLLRSSTAFQISVIGALQSFLLVFLGFLAGPIYDAGYFRHLLVAGSTLIFAGTLAQSFCTELWQLIVAEGACVGIGCGCLGVLSVAIPASWFSSRLPVANAIAASGSGVGGVVYPIIIRQMIPTVGFGWTIRTIAFIIAATLGLANVIVRDPRSSTRDSGTAEKQQQQAQPQGGVANEGGNPPQQQKTRQPVRRLIDKPSLKDWPYVFFVVACFLVFLGMYTPFYNVQTFAIVQVGMSSDVAFYIVMAMNIASIPGRIVPALFAARAGPLNLIIVASIGLGCTGLGLLGARSDATVYVVAVIYGFLTGSFFGLQPTVFVRVTSDMKVLGTRFGMAFTVFSVALLFGAPIGGQLVDEFGYYAAWIWVGVTMAAATSFIVLARITHG